MILRSLPVVESLCVTKNAYATYRRLSKPLIEGPMKGAVGRFASKVVSMIDTWTVEGDGGMFNLVDILGDSGVECTYRVIWQLYCDFKVVYLVLYVSCCPLLVRIFLRTFVTAIVQ